MRKNVQNEDLNLFASNLIENRVCFKHLPNDTPKGSISKFQVNQAVLNKDEWESYIYSSAVIVSRIPVEFFPKFSIFKDVYPNHIPHKYSKDEMQRKSFVKNIFEIQPVLEKFYLI